MRIGIVDADLMDNGTRHPNLALMKISGYYKEQGHEVRLIYNSYDEIDDYDKIFLAKVFSFTEIPDGIIDNEKVEYGGTGFYEDGGEDLPYEIEHHKPDYSLYDDYVNDQLKKGRKRSSLEDYMEYSIGFSTRGCFRQCKFCVNKKYKNVFKHSPIEEFLDENRPYIYLWDDNFLAYSNWEDILNDLEKTKKPFQFRQGLDLRLMTDHKAKRLNNTNYRGDFIFAFDHLEDKDKIIKKIQLWKRYSSKISKLYVICGFESQDEKDIERTFERIKILMKYGCLPYIMRHEYYKKSKYKGIYIQLARWCNQPQFFKKKSFREFCIANQIYKKDQRTKCSAYQAMTDFEYLFPDIAKKYFDLKYENENIYAMQYGYGRKYENKPLCELCKKNKQDWDFLLGSNNDYEVEKKFIELYFNKEIDTLCLKYNNSKCFFDSQKATEYLIDILSKYTLKEIIEILKDSKIKNDDVDSFIPQLNEFNNINTVLDILIKNNEFMQFDEIGENIINKIDTNCGKKITSKKLGENYSKLAVQLDLATVNKFGHNWHIKITELGKQMHKLDEAKKYDLELKLLLRIPEIKENIINDYGEIYKNTNRRKSSINEILNKIKEYY